MKLNRTEPIPRSSLLKVPTQRRSIDMIHHIMDVATEQLEQEGARALNTNRIAEGAGISTGSLYQYFANKEMILSGIIERAILDSQNTLKSMMGLAKGIPPKMLLLTGLHTIMEKLRPYQVVTREIFIAQPLLADTAVPAVMESFLLDILRDYLLLNNKFRIRGGLAAMYVAGNTIVYMFLRWVVDPPLGVTEDEFFSAIVEQVSSVFEEV